MDRPGGTPAPTKLRYIRSSGAQMTKEGSFNVAEME